MRLFEQVSAVLGGATRVVDATPAGSPEMFRLPDGVDYQRLPVGELTSGSSGRDDLLVGMLLPPTSSHDGLGALVGALGNGGRALVLVPGAPEDLPVPRLLDALGRHGGQVTAVLPAETPAGASAMLVQRSDEPVTFGSHLADGARSGVAAGQTADIPYVRRALNELVLSAFAARGWPRRVQDAEAELARVRGELADVVRRLEEETAKRQEAEVLAREVDGLKDEIRRLRTSTSFRTGRALADAARRPLSRGPRLPVTVYRLARERTRDVRTELKRAAGDLGADRPSTPVQPASAEVSDSPRTGADRTAALAATPAPAARRLVRLALPVPRDEPDGDDQGGELVLDVPVTSYVGRRLLASGLAGYEPEALATFLALLDIAPPGPVWDIGSNIGLYALLAGARSERDVHAFEPAPELADSLSRTLGRSTVRVAVHPVAVGAAEGAATLHLSDRTDSSNSLLEGFRPSSRSLEVPLRTVDALATEIGPPAVIKIDTEATEPDVVRGGLRTLAEHRPWVLCEVLANRVEKPLMELLEPLGYRWWHVGDQTPFEQPEDIVGDPEYRRLMWLFAPEAPDEVLWKAIARWRSAVDRCVPAP